jgi:hypothetical protein
MNKLCPHPYPKRGIVPYPRMAHYKFDIYLNLGAARTSVNKSLSSLVSL